MKTYYGLKEMRDVYCPSCGNYLKVVSNGFFHGELFFCKKEKKVYNIILRDVTKKAGKDFIEQSEFECDRKGLTYKITQENFKEVKEFLNKLNP